ncbi:MAG: hypothetical protein QNJ62_05000 [Methyloceanibacter sp.]|nr:hypothetical protein [Methyloceanibacter sp.]
MSAPERIWWLGPIAVETAEKFGRVSHKDVAALRADGLPREMAEALRRTNQILNDVLAEFAGHSIEVQVGVQFTENQDFLAKWDALMEKGDG